MGEQGKARVVAFANQKGGSGKTTTAAATAVLLGARGLRVLTCDLDPQRGNLSSALGADPLLIGTHELLSKDVAYAPADFVQVTAIGDLIAAGEDLDETQVELMSDSYDGNYRLADTLEAFSDSYDFILLDTPGSMSMLTVNALMAADEVVVPSEASEASRRGVERMVEDVARASRRGNPRLGIAGVLATQVRRTTRNDREELAALGEVCRERDARMFAATIRQASAIKAAMRSGDEGRLRSLIVDEPRGVGHDYRQFVSEWLGE